jgi:phospholipase C
MRVGPLSGVLGLTLLAAAGRLLSATACGTTSAGPPPFTAQGGSPDEDEAGDEPTDDGDEKSQPPPVPAPTIDAGSSFPSKIRYVLVLVKENHTFDNYFTGFPGAESSTTAKKSNGTTITRPTAPNGPLAKDPCHSNGCGQTAYRNGSMNGFELINAGDLPFVRYTEQQIPNYWQYARNFVLADHLFSATLGPSTPGHIVFWTGQSLVLDNPKCTTADGTKCTGYGCTADRFTKATAYDPNTCTTKSQAPCFDVPSLTDHLPEGFTWANYGGRLPMMVKSVTSDPSYATHFRKQTDLVPDLTTGHLANLTIAHLWSDDVSEHPAANPCVGENFTVEIVNAAMRLPQWNEMAIIVTWDDWGGFYDHVTPPAHRCKNGQVYRGGFRLPLILISPYAKKGFVLSTPAEQASVPRLVEDLWGVPYMSTRDPLARDGTAGSLMGAFDFEQAPREPLVLQPHSCP